MDQDREISREELHQLVWSKPTSTVAKEFGLSDVGFAKICHQHSRKSSRLFLADYHNSGRAGKAN